MALLQSILGFLGGLGIFLYGTHLLSNGLQKLAASKMRDHLTNMTNTRLKGVISGIFVTFFLQSSTVTSILVVGLVGGSIITMSQAFGVVLGSAIGTTLTVQVLTFDLSMYSSVFIFLGVVLQMFIKNNKWKTVGLISLSIGFIFFGIGFVTSSLEPLIEHENVLNYLLVISENKILFAFIAMIITALLHSSAAMIIIGIAFVNSGVMTMPDMLPLVLGANVGSTLPVVLSSLSSSLEGRKLAFFYLFFKVTGVALFFTILGPVSEIVELFPGSAERQVAHFHTTFNISIALLFFPFLPYVARMFNFLFPKREPATFTIKLNEKALDVPGEALINSRDEIIRLSNYVKENMIKRLVDYVDGNCGADEIIQVEHTINQSFIEIHQYLLKLGQKDLSSEQSNKEVKLLNILNDIEHIGDTVEHFIFVVEKIKDRNLNINKKDLTLLKKLLHHIENTYKNSLDAFQHDKPSIARRNIQSHSDIVQFEKDIKFEHFNSLINKSEYNPDVSGVYLDIVNELMHINHHSMNISRTVLGLI